MLSSPLSPHREPAPERAGMTFHRWLMLDIQRQAEEYYASWPKDAIPWLSTQPVATARDFYGLAGSR